MTYAYVVDDVVQKEQIELPESATLLADPGVWVTGLSFQSSSVWASTGWFLVQDVAKPADTDTVTYERSLTVVGDVPTVTWTQRNKTQEELTSANREKNYNTLTDVQEITNRVNALDDFLTDPDVQVILDVANTTPLTTQQLNRGLKAIVRQLRREANATIAMYRLTGGDTLLDTTDGTTGA